MKSKTNIINLFFIFTSKTGGILVGVYFLPLFNEVLGQHLFGIVALILSLQSLLLTLDLGMATLVGRDLALKDENPIIKIKNAELIIFLFYIILIPIVIPFCFFLAGNVVSVFDVFLLLVLFFVLTVQNISFSALMAKQKYKTSSSLQFISVVSRAYITLFYLQHVDKSISTFIEVQLVVSIINFIFIRLMVSYKIRTLFNHINKVTLEGCLSLVSRGKPLIVTSLAAAGVMQLDKVIVTSFLSPSHLVPYFLAFSFCMTPILALAGPVKQFFQPKIIVELNSKIIHFKQVDYFVIVMMIVTVVPSLILWMFRLDFLTYWLGEHADLLLISSFVKILMPGMLIGAIGYIPVVLMLVVEDFKFQACLSVITALTVLFFVGVFSMYERIDLICWSYSIYFLVISIACWWRMLLNKKIGLIALSALKNTIIALVIICSFFVIVGIINE